MIHSFLPGKALRRDVVMILWTGWCHVSGTFSGFKKHLNTKHAYEIEHQGSTITKDFGKQTPKTHGSTVGMF